MDSCYHSPTTPADDRSDPANRSAQLSGERFRIVYRLGGTEEEARARARDICLEQTVEFPDELVPEGPIRDHVVGRLESFEPRGDGRAIRP